MSERQQLALVMQISSQDAPPGKLVAFACMFFSLEQLLRLPAIPCSAAPTPAEERKRTRQQRNERGETPLHVAAIRGDHDQVKKLLDQGQDPDVPDFAGNVLFCHLCQCFIILYTFIQLYFFTFCF